MIEKIGDNDEEHSTPVNDAVIGNGGSEMGLATAAGPHKHQPTLRVLGKGPCPLTGLTEPLLIGRLAASSSRVQVIEGEAGQGAEVTVLLQAPQAPALQFLLGTATGHHPAKVRMP